MEITILGGISLWVIVEAIVKLLKAGGVNTKYLPYMNVLAGLVIVIGAQLLGLLDITLGASIYTGLVVGLAAAGFYDFRRDLTKGL